MFDDSLEGLTELRKAFSLLVMVYYPERIQIENIKERRSIRSRRCQAQASNCPFPVESSEQHPALPATVCDNTHRVLKPGILS